MEQVSFNHGTLPTYKGELFGLGEAWNTKILSNTPFKYILSLLELATTAT